MKKILIILAFAGATALLYWLRAEFNITLFSKQTPSGGFKDIEFDPAQCALWAAIGGAVGALSAFTKKGKKREGSSK